MGNLYQSLSQMLLLIEILLNFDQKLKISLFNAVIADFLVMKHEEALMLCH